MRRKDYFVLTGRISVVKKILDYGFLSCFLLAPIIKNSVLSSFDIRLSEIIQLLTSLIQSVIDLMTKSASADRLGVNDTTVYRLRSSELVGGGVRRSETVCACR